MQPGWRAPLAESIGTFALVFIGAGSIIANELTGGAVGLLGIAFAHGIVLAVMVTATMNISGGHINPAVTVALWLGGQFEAKRIPVYIIAQLIGAALAGFLLKALYPSAAATAAGLGTPVPAEGVSFVLAVAIEAVLTFFLMFSIYGTAVDPRAPKVGGFGIGLGLVFDILAGGPLTGASMNPARTLGSALAGGVWDDHLVYWIGPLLGAAVGALIYGRLLMADSKPEAGSAAG